jgi:hypothetical protein
MKKLFKLYAWRMINGSKVTVDTVSVYDSSSANLKSNYRTFLGMIGKDFDGIDIVHYGIQQ